MTFVDKKGDSKKVKSGNMLKYEVKEMSNNNPFSRLIEMSAKGTFAKTS